LGRHRVKLPADTNVLDGFPKVAPSSQQLRYQIAFQNLKACLARVFLVPDRFVEDRRGTLVSFQVFISHRPSAPVTEIALVISSQLLGSAGLRIIVFAVLAIDTVALRTRFHVHCGGGPPKLQRCRGWRPASFQYPCAVTFYCHRCQGQHSFVSATVDSGHRCREL
jgi:hypothetical protein